MNVTTAADLLHEAEMLCREMRTSGLPVTPEDWFAVERASRRALTQMVGLPAVGTIDDADVRRQWRDLVRHPDPDRTPPGGWHVEADDPRAVPRLAMVLSVLGDVLAHDPQHLPQPIPSDEQVEAARRILTITAVAARQAITTGRLADCQAPFDAGRHAESLLDALGAPGAFPRSLHRIQSVSLIQALEGTNDLARAAALWDKAFREEMSRSIVPSLDVLRSLVNTGRHAYAVTAGAAPRAGSEADPERLAALRDAGKSLGDIEENWPKVATTLVRPGHAFIGASRDLYVALTSVQKELETQGTAADLEAATSSLHWLTDRASQHVAESSRLPERLLKSGLVFAPAGTIRPTPARLPARAKRRFTAADIDDYPTFVAAWQEAELATRTARATACHIGPVELGSAAMQPVMA